jgi:hypothetical protein
MKSKVIPVTVFIFFLFTTVSFSQYLNQDVKLNLKKDLNKVSAVKPAGANVTLGAGLGFAFVKGNTGAAVAMFSELKFDKFSFVPTASYWKVEDRSNFEMAALGRYTLTSTNMRPYFDAGIGFNFYDNNNTGTSFTKIGLSIGAGLDFPNLIENAVVFIDGKYKVIINDDEERNIEGYTLIGGIKFIM